MIYREISEFREKNLPRFFSLTDLTELPVTHFCVNRGTMAMAGGASLRARIAA